MEDVLRASADLMDTLRKARELVKKLLEFSKTKESLLKTDEVSGLKKLLEKEEDIITAVKENEEDRKLKAGILAAAAGVREENVKLKDIIKLIEYPSCRTELEKAGSELTEEIGRLTQQNEKIKNLLQYKINYTNYMINLLYVPQKNVFSYNMQGNKEDESGSLNFLDYRA